MMVGHSDCSHPNPYSNVLKWALGKNPHESEQIFIQHSERKERYIATSKSTTSTLLIYCIIRPHAFGYFINHHTKPNLLRYLWKCSILTHSLMLPRLYTLTLHTLNLITYRVYRQNMVVLSNPSSVVAFIHKPWIIIFIPKCIDNTLSNEIRDLFCKLLYNWVSW